MATVVVFASLFFIQLAQIDITCGINVEEEANKNWEKNRDFPTFDFIQLTVYMNCGKCS